jgi:hypothetical protein
VAADLIAQHPDWDAEEVIHRMTDTADELASRVKYLNEDVLLDAPSAICGHSH